MQNAGSNNCRSLPALQSQDLVEVLEWTSAALNRVDSNAFFARFNEGDAVIYFYEPFLKAFDPKLRTELGVWYTPAEVVRYMVARVDKALKEDLGIAEGLAAENVYVLDPCCGTGAFLAEALRRIATNLKIRVRAPSLVLELSRRRPNAYSALKLCLHLWSSPICKSG